MILAELDLLAQKIKLKQLLKIQKLKLNIKTKMDQEKPKKNFIDEILQKERDKKKKFYYPFLLVLTYLWGIPIILFVYLIKGIDWILTKCHLKKPEPKITPHYFIIREMQTDKGIFQNEDESIVKAEEARMIAKYGKAKYDQNFYLSEVHLCGIVPQTIVQKLTHALLRLLP